MTTDTAGRYFVITGRVIGWDEDDIQIIQAPNATDAGSLFMDTLKETSAPEVVFDEEILVTAIVDCGYQKPTILVGQL